MEINVKLYLQEQDLTIYQVAKKSGYGYTTLHKSFNKSQGTATSLNIRDLDALARSQNLQMWEVLKVLEDRFME